MKTLVPLQGVGLRAARVASGKSLSEVAHEAPVSRFKLFEAEHDRAALTDDEIAKVSRVLPALRVDGAPGSYTAIVEILKVVAHDPEMNDVERGNAASFIIKMLRAGAGHTVEAVEKLQRPALTKA